MKSVGRYTTEALEIIVWAIDVGVQCASNRSTRLREDENRKLGRPGRPVAVGYIGLDDKRQMADEDTVGSRISG